MFRIQLSIIALDTLYNLLRNALHSRDRVSKQMTHTSVQKMGAKSLLKSRTRNAFRLVLVWFLGIEDAAFINSCFQGRHWKPCKLFRDIFSLFHFEIQKTIEKRRKGFFSSQLLVKHSAVEQTTSFSSAHPRILLPLKRKKLSSRPRNSYIKEVQKKSRNAHWRRRNSWAARDTIRSFVDPFLAPEII